MQIRTKIRIFGIGILVMLVIIGSFAVLYYAPFQTNACLLQTETLWDDRVASPVDAWEITSLFNAVDSAHEEPHSGVDIAAKGSAYAVDSGVVIANFYNNVRGNSIAVAFKANNHRYYTYLYQHLAVKSPLLVGSNVEIGQVIGEIGNSGRSFGVHLHAEVEFANMINGVPSWKGTYPTNTDVMFDFIDFFQLSKQFELS